MAIYEIPLDNGDPKFSFDANLGEYTYYFDFMFSTRSNIWFISIRDYNNEPLVTGEPFYSNTVLLEHYFPETKWVGDLYVANINKPGVDADRYTLGIDVFLYHDDGLEE